MSPWNTWSIVVRAAAGDDQNAAIDEGFNPRAAPHERSLFAHVQPTVVRVH